MELANTDSGVFLHQSFLRQMLDDGLDLDED
jgi:hypothetical protein